MQSIAGVVELVAAGVSSEKTNIWALINHCMHADNEKFMKKYGSESMLLH